MGNVMVIIFNASYSPCIECLHEIIDTWKRRKRRKPNYVFSSKNGGPASCCYWAAVMATTNNIESNLRVVGSATLTTNKVWSICNEDLSWSPSIKLIETTTESCCMLLSSCSLCWVTSRPVTKNLGWLTRKVAVAAARRRLDTCWSIFVRPFHLFSHRNNSFASQRNLFALLDLVSFKVLRYTSLDKLA